jgi:NAD-dependent SIR2 family protein deacetylase
MEQCIKCGQETDDWMEHKKTGRKVYLCDGCYVEMLKKCNTGEDIDAYMNKLLNQKEAKNDGKAKEDTVSTRNIRAAD